MPRLGIFAPPTVESKLPFYWYLSPADQAVFDERFPRLLQWFSDVIVSLRSTSRSPLTRSNKLRPLYTLCVHQQRGGGRAGDAEVLEGCLSGEIDQR